MSGVTDRTPDPDSGIVERLRAETSCWPDMAAEAADEIERLSAEVAALRERTTPAQHVVVRASEDFGEHCWDIFAPSGAIVWTGNTAALRSLGIDPFAELGVLTMPDNPPMMGCNLAGYLKVLRAAGYEGAAQLIEHAYLSADAPVPAETTAGGER